MELEHWKLSPTKNCESHIKKYGKPQKKKHLDAVLANLQTFRKVISAPGVIPQSVKAVYIHRRYRSGLMSIGQEGGGVGLTKTRLYIWPDSETRTIHMFHIGGEKGQSKDVDECYSEIRKLKSVVTKGESSL